MTTMQWIELDEVDSTNEYCKREDRGRDMNVCALRQIKGRGTKGRSFISPDGGLYLSLLRHYRDFAAADAFHIMVNACVAVCRAVESFGVRPVIRWANDVLVNGLKISGTLIENSFSGNRVRRSIVGIGINVNNALPRELDGIATSLRAAVGKEVDMGAFKRALFARMSEEFTIADYKGYMPWLGAEVALHTAEGVRTVRAEDIAADGRLVVSDGGATRLISAAEVSLRL